MVIEINNNNYSIKKPLITKPINQNNDFIVQPFGAGLGDNLWHSKIPYLAKQVGYEKVYISTNAGYRNESYKYLIWELNPYVDGYTKEVKTLYHNKNGFCTKNRNNDTLTIVDYINSLYGEKFKTQGDRPQVFYSPNCLDIDNLPSLIFDPNYVFDSRINDFSISNIKLHLTKNVKRLGLLGSIKNNNTIRKPVDEKYGLNQNRLDINIGFSDEIFCENVMDFADLLYSCDKFISLTTGTIVLADALSIRLDVFLSYPRVNPIHPKIHNYIYV